MTRPLASLSSSGGNADNSPPNGAHRKPAHLPRDRRIPQRIFLLSQAERPGEIKKSLLDSAVSDGWINLLVNINTAIFVGLIALTADFGATQSLGFLGLQLTFTFVGTVIFLFLQLRRQSNRHVSPGATEKLLTLSDFLLMGSWGFGVLLFVSPLHYDRSLLTIVLLTAAGISSAALNAKLLPTLVIGRIILFLPSLVYYLNVQPPFWGLLICTLFFACAVSIGIGYAIHVQHLHEANLAFKLRETSVLLEQQSFSLERSLLLEHQAQNRILKETKLREQFLHSISHDLNQPLSALALYLNDLESQTLPERTRASVLSAGQCLGSARTLVQSVSQLAWIEEHLPPPTLSDVALQPLIARLVDEARPVARSKNLELVSVPSSVRVKADAEFLERVLRNLLHNALQYTAEGRVMIGVRRRSGALAEIVVADTGLGISNEDQAHIFEAFFQTNTARSRQAGNVGLGLSIVHDLVSAMNGRITLASIEGRGSTFGVVLPVSESSTPHERPQRAKRLTNAGNGKSLGKVLLCEDREDYQRTISAMLTDLGYAVDSAATPAELAAISGEALADYHTLVLDFDLGNGVTAFDILNRCDADRLPAYLIISQYDDPNTVFEIKERGGRFLKKPFDAKDLEITLRVLEKGAQATPSGT